MSGLVGMVAPEGVMDDPYAVDRRDFLGTGATAAAATAVGCGRSDSPWRALTEAEARTLAAACDQIIPPDDTPGAAEAGAVVFVDRQLATREKDQLDVWRRGLAGLEATARRRHGTSFAELDVDGQTALLQDVEAGRVEAADWSGVEAPVFFERLVSYTMMGFYGDPRHGGNREWVSWRMLGVRSPPVRGRLHEAPSPGSPPGKRG